MSYKKIPDQQVKIINHCIVNVLVFVDCFIRSAYGETCCSIRNILVKCNNAYA